MDSGSIAAIIVAVIALVSGFASQRSASKASTSNVTLETRVDMERDAYLRARKLDTESISRLESENIELRKDEDESKKKQDELEKKLEEAKRRIDDLEKEVYRWKMAFVRNNKTGTADMEAGD